MKKEPVELWQTEVRKMVGEPLVEVILGLQEGQREIVTTLAQFDKRQEHTEQEIINIKKAFPDGDMEGHRRYHETMIEMLQERRRLRAAIQEKTISALIWVCIVAAAGGIWHSMKDALSK